VLSAYRDNAAVIEGATAHRFFPILLTRRYGGVREPVDILMKVETHNHPTAISPFPGCGDRRGRRNSRRGRDRHRGQAQGRLDRLFGFESENSRDAAALGARLRQARAHRLGARHHDRRAVWVPPPSTMNSAAPTPADIFAPSNSSSGGWARGGYHKPIMIAGGLGNVRRGHVEKRDVVVGAPLVVLGGPSMLIGLGGGAASSVGSGQSSLGSGFRVGAARQCGNSAPCSGSHRPLLGHGRAKSHSADSRCGRGRTVERVA
jgi:phosphoribosylformylglycinamidine synthase